MAFEIEIVEGHDPSSYFWFRPVIVDKKDKITWDNVKELDDEFSIEEGNIDCFLAYFLFKHFDSDLYYNQHRYECYEGYIEHFEWYLTHNFYTYETLSKMLNDIESAADMLKKDYYNPMLAPIKERFSIFYMCEQNHPDWINGNKMAIEDHVDVVIDFYNRFVARVRKMMIDNPQTNLLSIMGP